MYWWEWVRRGGGEREKGEKGNLNQILLNFKAQVAKFLRTEAGKQQLAQNQEAFLSKCLQYSWVDMAQRLEYFLATGNLKSPTGLDLLQMSGYTIVGEKLNFLRYLAHFRSVHRGAFFTEMKTTSVRKLLPESWGFMCPVHTPDGTPCGLLNHLSWTCFVDGEPVNTDGLPEVCVEIGMSPINNNMALSFPQSYYTVLLDGKVIGKVHPSIATKFVDQLRHMKLNRMDGVPKNLEIGFVPITKAGQYPGIFLFTNPARMLRQVEHLASHKLETISTFEQVYLDIACLDEDVIADVTTHREIAPTNMLSVVASLTPFSDFNQSPRNMYQCQMGKQTMGTPCHTFPHRTDNKMYRVQTPQSPICQTKAHQQFMIDDYPLGTNAIVAVIAYTGYDMEDAMIVNRSSYQRGFGHGTVYKTEFVELDGFSGKQPITQTFGNPYNDMGELSCASLDDDGLPALGTHLSYHDPLYCTISQVTGKVKVHPYKYQEPAIVEEVRMIACEDPEKPLQKVSIKLRFNRNPIIGDKFSSRHGQKGILSQLWPASDMPFTESGMLPDIIINPHAFPSRMTIGMLVESMAGKSGAINGIYQDATPFQFDENTRAADYFGQQLVDAGYNFYGQEPMYSGTNGTELYADIFIGSVYYQRLRHMVSDKYQVRAMGPVNRLTHQPIKGRKMGGGIRFGEMERDSLLSHGVSFLLHDRLMNCSDAEMTFVCSHCGSVLSPVVRTATAISQAKLSCISCKSSKGIRRVALPYVFRYLANELGAMNIRLTLKVAEK
eukprot:TRINITY_DN1906_c0_g2_i4.p1 TRINITY_DN1906_c0_g2~~TRINITY_DN1906_c0_g2_i4.p1  ORF type:complete len:775 (+),score=210.16 TRINITY_DN1906_c0_g2_i4:20-2344(+)